MSKEIILSVNEMIYENDFMRLELREGILFGTYKEGSITLEMAKEVVENRINFTHNKDVPILINDNGLTSIDKDARAYLSSDDGIKGLKAGALVTNSIFGRHLANFFIKISVIKPKIPTRLFSDEKEAVKWLKQFR